MAKRKHVSLISVLSALKEYSNYRAINYGCYNLRNVTQQGNSLTFKIGEVSGRITLEKRIMNNYYLSKFEVKKWDFYSDSKNICLKVKGNSKGVISLQKNSSSFEDYIETLGDFSSEYSKKLKSSEDNKTANQQ